MNKGQISRQVVVDRLGWLGRMIQTIRDLPLDDSQAFFSDDRNVWTADACLRRSLEALFDLGRHILSKGFSQVPSEYKEVAIVLGQMDVLTDEDVALLRLMGGYRNRLVHFYHEISPEELFDICTHDLGDVDRLAEAFRRWLLANSDMLDSSL